PPIPLLTSNSQADSKKFYLTFSNKHYNAAVPGKFRPQEGVESLSEKRDTTDNFTKVVSKRVCNFWRASGTCPRGSDCHFRHPIAKKATNPPPPPTPVVPVTRVQITAAKNISVKKIYITKLP